MRLSDSRPGIGGRIIDAIYVVPSILIVGTRDVQLAPGAGIRVGKGRVVSAGRGRRVGGKSGGGGGGRGCLSFSCGRGGCFKYMAGGAPPVKAIAFGELP